jgi:hypothetical protein
MSAHTETRLLIHKQRVAGIGDELVAREEARSLTVKVATSDLARHARDSDKLPTLGKCGWLLKWRCPRSDPTQYDTETDQNHSLQDGRLQLQEVHSMF